MGWIDAYHLLPAELYHEAPVARRVVCFPERYDSIMDQGFWGTIVVEPLVVYFIRWRCFFVINELAHITISYKMSRLKRRYTRHFCRNGRLE